MTGAEYNKNPLGCVICGRLHGRSDDCPRYKSNSPQRDDFYKGMSELGAATFNNVPYKDEMKKETVELEVGSWPWALYKMSQGLNVSCKTLNNYNMFAFLQGGETRVMTVGDSEEDAEPIEDQIDPRIDGWFVFDLKAAKEEEIYREINELEDRKKKLQDKLKKL